jgi:hypothetical protein
LTGILIVLIAALFGFERLGREQQRKMIEQPVSLPVQKSVPAPKSNAG